MIWWRIKRYDFKSDGNVSIAAALTTGSNFTVNGYITYGNNVWNRSADGIYRTYYATNEISYYCCGGTSSTIGHIFYNNGYSNVFQIKNNGDASCTGSFTASGK